jgi:hypothetical protein
LDFKLEISPYNFFIRSFAKFEASDMTPQHEEEGSVNPAANPAALMTSRASPNFNMAPTVCNSSIHEKEHWNISYRFYRVYGDLDRGWEDIMSPEKQGIAPTILSMENWEAEESLRTLKEEGSHSIKTFTECLRGLLRREEPGRLRILYG